MGITMRYPYSRGKRRTLMEMNGFALAYLATIYTMMVLLPYNFLTYLLDPSRRRPKVMHKSVQPGQSNFALKEGQTIVGVRATTKALCFYIDTDIMDEKDYE
jgi:hypothetical protein